MIATKSLDASYLWPTGLAQDGKVECDSAMRPRSIGRVVTAVIVAPIASWLVMALIPADRSGQATMAGMVNVAYAIALVEHLVLLTLVYGVVVPVAAPRLALSAMSSLSIGLSIGGVLFIWMLYRLGLLHGSDLDYFASVTVRNSVVGTVVAVLLIFWIGFWNNSLGSMCHAVPVRLCPNRLARPVDDPVLSLPSQRYGSSLR